MGVWDWVVDVMKKTADEVKEYMAQYFQNKKDDPEFRARRYEAVKKYRARKMAEDPEGFAEYRRKSINESSKRSQAKKRASWTEEELEEYRKKTRERVAEYRRRKKAEKAAQEAAQKGEQ